MGIYAETAEKLRVLGVNESKMNKQQFERYANVLKKYRTEIIAGANEVLKHFWLSGMAVEKEDAADGEGGLFKKIQSIIDDEASKGEMKRLHDILFQTYSMDKFLNAAYRVRCRILYESYAPYWIGKCSLMPLLDGIPWAGVPAAPSVWYNSLVNMYWWDEHRVWVRAGREKSFGAFLPPTEGLCRTEYVRERRAMGNA